MVVPTFAPIMNGAAMRSLTTFLATSGTTTDVVMVLDLMAAVVINPQKKDFISPAKKNRLKFSGDCALSKSEISFLKIKIEMTRRMKETTVNAMGLGISRTRKSVAKLKGVHAVPETFATSPDDGNIACPNHEDAEDKKP